MNSTHYVRLATEFSHNSFISWLSAFCHENKIEANAKSRFIRVGGVFAVMQFSPDGKSDDIINAAAAFGTLIDENGNAVPYPILDSYA